MPLPKKNKACVRILLCHTQIKVDIRTICDSDSRNLAKVLVIHIRERYCKEAWPIMCMKPVAKHVFANLIVMCYI